jgi:mono/diheme cytochrome c family protein
MGLAMYSIDTNNLMHCALSTIFISAMMLLLYQHCYTGVGPRLAIIRQDSFWYSIPLMSFILITASFGFRDRRFSNRPLQFTIDMKNQPKYYAQSQNNYFADQRDMRTPTFATIPYDGLDYSSDAGYHDDPIAGFKTADSRYYTGVANPKLIRYETDGTATPEPTIWQDQRLIKEGYYTSHIPDRVVDNEGSWELLLNKGQNLYKVYCAACHGSDGRGGQRDTAHGIVGSYGLSTSPANLNSDNIQHQPDGQIYSTILHGKGAMSGYGSQVPAQERWAIIAHVRLLQNAYNTRSKANQ